VTPEELAQDTANKALLKLGGEGAVYVFVTTEGKSASSLAANGNFSIDSLIATIVQLLGDLRVRVVKGVQAQATIAPEGPRGQKPAGN
jgi:hypothetical protein